MANPGHRVKALAQMKSWRRNHKLLGCEFLKNNGLDSRPYSPRSGRWWVETAVVKIVLLYIDIYVAFSLCGNSAPAGSSSLVMWWWSEMQASRFWYVNEVSDWFSNLTVCIPKHLRVLKIHVVWTHNRLIESGFLGMWRCLLGFSHNSPSSSNCSQWLNTSTRPCLDPWNLLFRADVGSLVGSQCDRESKKCIW